MIALNNDQQTFPIYSWVQGFIYYKVHRNYRDGRRETVAKIPIYVTGSKKMIELITKQLSEHKLDILSDEICEKHLWINTKLGRICENCAKIDKQFK